MPDKLPIPRLRRERQESGGRRTSRACDSCRQRKIKCDGNRPACSLCLAQGLNNCFYSDAKAVQQQKDLDLMKRKIESYEELLRDISGQLEGLPADQVAKALESSHRANSEGHQNRPYSASSSSSVGSLDAIDVVEEDLNRTDKSRATGYMGKNSEVTWMQCLDSEITKTRGEAPPHMITPHQIPIDDSIASMNYHLDYQSLSDLQVTNAFILPPKSLADQLIQVYLKKIDISFPFIRRDLFIAQCSQCYSAGHMKPGRKWLAIFNMIFAIGCATCRLSGQILPHEADENVFLARARSLGLSESVLYDHDDLQRVQAEALMAFYFLVVSQINRSWKMIGLAARSGIALGLNLRQTTSEHDLKSDEARKLLWWSIFRLENVLSVMTGRVSCLGSAFCSLSPPQLEPILNSAGSGNRPSTNAHQWTIELGKTQMDSQRDVLQSLTPSRSLHFFYMVDLSLIVHSIINEVYAIDSSRAGRARVEGRITYYNKKMDNWVTSLHPSFCFQDSHGNLQMGISSPFQISLALNYFSARIVLNRPCLNNHAFGKKSVTQPSRSRFTNMTALNCLRAALAVMALLPDQPDLNWCYEVLQWWDLLHILTQSIVVLLLEISIGPIPTKSDQSAISVEPTLLVWTRVKQGLSWLHCMGKTSEAARRAFQFFDSCIHRIAPAKGLDLRGIPLMFGSSQTSCDSNFPWLRDSFEECTMTPQKGLQSSNQIYLESTESDNFSRQGHTSDDDPTPRYPEIQSPLNRVPGTSAVLDPDIDMSELISTSDSNIGSLLLFMMGSNV